MKTRTERTENGFHRCTLISIGCAEDRRGRRERLKSDRVMRKGLLKSRLLRYKSNEIRMNGLSWIAGLYSSFERKSDCWGTEHLPTFLKAGASESRLLLRSGRRQV